MMEHWICILLALVTTLAVAAGMGAICDRRLAKRVASLRRDMREHLNERERAADERHDGLLQGLHGLILRFQAVVDRMPPDDPARPGMDAVLQRADRMLVEGRLDHERPPAPAP